ncbi:MAG: hypothetical protein GVY28_13690 [Alphaproteobacteria bacterium]|jgi:membrane-bound inhibitor of C-type lysozyme|nr:hypothetical protein [Alphaproteobacteria bacterium]
MIRYSAFAAALAALAACAPTADRDRPIEEAPTLYSCADGTLAAAVFVDGRPPAVLVSVDGAPSLRLERTGADGGTRYSNGATTLTVRGGGAATLATSSGETDCTVDGGSPAGSPGGPPVG